MRLAFRLSREEAVAKTQCFGLFLSIVHARLMSGLHGDVFPIPLPRVEDAARSNLARGTRQRVGKRRARDSAAAETIRSLNVAAVGLVDEARIIQTE